jgi:glycosyltransferase involved in cell wall biosynthesis
VRVGLLSTSFPRGEDDAAGHFVLGFARALVSRGHRVEVLAPAPSEPAYPDAPRFAGIDVHWLSYLPRPLQRTFYGAGVLDNLRASPWAALGVPPFVLALTRETRARMPQWDAVVSHWALPSALVAGELAGARPHLAVLHSADVFVLERLPSRTLRRVLATRIARGASAMLFSSRDLRRRFLALLGPLPRAELSARAHVCAMGIEPAQVSSEPRAALRARLSLSRFTLLCLGRLIALKGLMHAIEAVASLPEVELVIVGYGPERSALEAEAQRRGVAVRFVGAQYGEHKADWLRAADAFVLPSVVLASGRTEGMPTTLLEAMEYGLPVIASDVGGVSDVVRSSENGFLVRPESAREIVHAVRALLDAATREQLAHGARQTAAQYRWEVLAPMLEGLLAGDRA